MAVLRKILLILAILIVILFAVSFFLPKEATVERSTVINAKPAKVFDYLNQMKNFNDWSPWFEMDPEGKYEVSGADIGVGSKFSWDSEKTGIGTYEIVDSNPYQSLDLSLNFDGQPPAKARYDLAVEGEGTKVTWKVTSPLADPLQKYMGLMMDSFIGGTFEKGLANLKTKVEAIPEEVIVPDSEAHPEKVEHEPEMVEVDAQTLIYESNKADFDGDLISQALAASYGKLVAFMAQKQINFAGPPIAITTGGSPEEGFWAFEAALPIDVPTEVDADSDIQFKQSYAGKAVKLVHIGSYMSMTASYEKLGQYVAEKGLEMNGNVWEQYISDPAVTPEAELITYLYFPVK